MLFVSASARRAMALPLLLAWLVCPCVRFMEPAAARESVRTYRVVYVAPGDVLNLRSGPSVAYPVVGAIPPGGRGLHLVGRCQDWCPVSYNGALGWVNPAYLAPELVPSAERPGSEEPMLPQRASGYVAAAPLAARKRGGLPNYWQVTGVAEGESLKVHDAPSINASVVHAFEPQSACIKLTGSCQKPWCQVTFPGLNGDRVGWVHAKHLAPSHSACSN